MNNERVNGLLSYLSELTKLTDTDGYICVKEITECIGWIREEFEKEPVDTVEVELDGKVVSRKVFPRI